MNRTPLVDPREGLRPNAPTWWPVLIPAGLVLVLAGLFIGAKIEEGTAMPATKGPRLVDTTGHEGQTLVVETDGSTRWCEQTDHACHETGE